MYRLDKSNAIASRVEKIWFSYFSRLIVVLKQWIMCTTKFSETLKTVRDKGWINFVSVRRNRCCITNIATSLIIIGNYLMCNKKVLIVEKRRSKTKPALEVQRLPISLDLINVSATSKFTVSPLHIPKTFFQDTRSRISIEVNRTVFVYVFFFIKDILNVKNTNKSI